MVKKNKKRRRKKNKSQVVKQSSNNNREIDSVDPRYMAQPVNIQVSTTYTIPNIIYYYDEAKDFLHLSAENFADKLLEYNNYSEDWCYWNYT